MAKKPVATTPGPALTHNPFAALSGAALPPGPTTPGPTAPGPTTVAASPDEDPREAPAGSRKIVVRHERKGRGGKTVTRISGLEAGELSSFTTRMKKALGCGATIEGDELVLLGDLVDRAAGWLETQHLGRVVRGT
ncbi:MAG: translation initiation factor [Sandaracinaceae bacterium]